MGTREFPVPGAFMTYPDVYRDERGFFSCVNDDPGIFGGPTRDCFARSSFGVIRGLHIRAGGGEAKLVRCTAGVIYDVTVDLRPGSPQYKRWFSVMLDGYSQASLYIPAGCAHGYQAVTAPADVAYRIEGSYDPEADLVIKWDDPELGVKWPLPPAFMSERDRNAPLLADVKELR